jgi:hypothetical protein
LAFYYAALLLTSASLPAAYADSLEVALAKAAPNANAKVIALAVRATQCTRTQGAVPAQRLAVIDYSLPSTEQRLWVFDLKKRKLLFHELVAHGRNSGENMATLFSNQNESYATSLGLFRTQESYRGQNGYSLRMEGLEPGFNDNAYDRAIVIHGAPYVSPVLAKGQRPHRPKPRLPRGPAGDCPSADRLDEGRATAVFLLPGSALAEVIVLHQLRRAAPWRRPTSPTKRQ